jgi:ketosteroid isomerase-like protein
MIFLRPLLLATALLLAGGVAAASSEPAEAAAAAQIRERILSIRDAIRAREPEGIVRWGTLDWTFTGPDGQSYDRAAYLERARRLFAQLVSLDSLETAIDRVDVRGEVAEVEITQQLERHERDPQTGRVLHVRLRYREHHDWMRTADGWRVRAVRFLGAPERTLLDR